MHGRFGNLKRIDIYQIEAGEKRGGAVTARVVEGIIALPERGDFRSCRDSPPPSPSFCRLFARHAFHVFSFIIPCSFSFSSLLFLAYRHQTRSFEPVFENEIREIGDPFFLYIVSPSFRSAALLLR